MKMNDTADNFVSRNNEETSTSNSIPVCLMQANTTTTLTFFLFLVFTFFLIPLIVLIILYSCIVRHLIRDSSTSTSNSSNTGESYQNRARKQVVLMLLGVVLSFFICLAPFKILTLYLILAPTEQVFDIDLDTYFNILYSSRIMFYLNSAVDPILYNLMSSKFRAGFLEFCVNTKKRNLERRTFRSSVNGTRRNPNVDQEENFL